MQRSTYKKFSGILLIAMFIATAAGAHGLAMLLLVGVGGGTVLYIELIRPIYNWIKEKIEDKQIMNEIKKDMEKERKM